MTEETLKKAIEINNIIAELERKEQTLILMIESAPKMDLFISAEFRGTTQILATSKHSIELYNSLLEKCLLATRRKLVKYRKEFAAL